MSNFITTPTGYIEINHETFDGNPLITISNTEMETLSMMHVDNYQAYKLAMYLLKRIDVVDTRGNN